MRPVKTNIVTLNDLINAPGRLFDFRGPSRGDLQIGGIRKLVYSHNCSKLNKTNMLSAKISREFKKSGIEFM